MYCFYISYKKFFIQFRSVVDVRTAALQARLRVLNNIAEKRLLSFYTHKFRDHGLLILNLPKLAFQIILHCFLYSITFQFNYANVYGGLLYYSSYVIIIIHNLWLVKIRSIIMINKLVPLSSGSFITYHDIVKK